MNQIQNIRISVQYSSSVKSEIDSNRIPPYTAINTHIQLFTAVYLARRLSKIPGIFDRVTRGLNRSLPADG